MVSVPSELNSSCTVVDNWSAHEIAEAIKVAFNELRSAWELNLPIETLREMYHRFCDFLMSPSIAGRSGQLLPIMRAWELDVTIRRLCNEIETTLELYLGLTWE